MRRDGEIFQCDTLAVLNDERRGELMKNKSRTLTVYLYATHIDERKHDFFVATCVVTGSEEADMSAVLVKMILGGLKRKRVPIVQFGQYFLQKRRRIIGSATLKEMKHGTFSVNVSFRQ